MMMYYICKYGKNTRFDSGSESCLKFLPAITCHVFIKTGDAMRSVCW